MTNPSRAILAAGLLALAAACTPSIADKEDPLPKTLVEAGQLEDLLLTAGDPEESIALPQRSRDDLSRSVQRVGYRVDPYLRIVCRRSEMDEISTGEGHA